MTELPESWADVEIIDVLAPNENGRPFQQGWSPQCESYPAEATQWGVLKTTAIQHGVFWPHENKALPASLEPRPQVEVKVGDVLMTCAGPRNRCGVACLVEATPQRLMMSGKMYRFRPHPEALHPKYLAYLIRRRETQLEIDRMKTGISDSGLNLTHDKFSQLRVPLPPLPEQHRIVAKVEALFSELEAGEASLTRARAQLSLYRQSLLKAAFQGKLTADWRASNPDKLEPPEILLSRIRKERDARYKSALDDWQTALSAWRAGGEVGRKPGKPNRLAEVTDGSTSFRADGWLAMPLDFLIGDMQQGWSPTCDGNAAVQNDAWAIVKTTAVQHGHYDDTAIKLLPTNLEPKPEIEIVAGDFLMTRKGPRARTGVVCLVRQTRSKIMLCDTVYRFRCDEGLICPPLLELALNAPDTLRELDSLKAGISESGISLNHGKVRSVTIQFPRNMQEQLELVRLVDSQITQVDAIESEITTALAKITALRQSILKQAFSGQLVPQDPSDEPASALLDRLRAQTPDAKPRRKKTA